jgi:hypothetical protein
MANLSKKDSVSVPFHGMTLIATSALTAIAYNFNPTVLSASLGITRPLQIADNYAQFRVDKLAFRVHPMAAEANGYLAFGYVGGVQDTFPATLAAIGELISSNVLGASEQVPTGWVKPTKQELAGPFPWYHSVVGTMDATEESPGTLVFYPQSTGSFMFEIKGVLTFKISVGGGNTPAQLKLMKELRELRAAKAAEDERARLVRVLGGQPVIVPPNTTIGSPGVALLKQ